MDAAIMAASEKQAFVAQDREIMDIYERRQKARWDYASAMNGARREGMEEGMEIGREKGLEEGIERGKDERNAEVARNALAKGIPAEVICEITGLEMDTIAGLMQG